MGLLGDLFDVGNGIRSGIEDVPSLLGDVLTGDVHGAVTDGRKLVGDVGDVLEGVQDLGASVGRISARYAGTVGKLADSPILSAAQLVIEGEKKLTGSGDPEEGEGYRESARRLQECVQTLSQADPHEDRWNGAASASYHATNSAHRSLVSQVLNADHNVAQILALEADQVTRTRKTLDDTSQRLYDYGLATAIVSLLPGANAAKLAADAAAASAALATTNEAMAALAANSVKNAFDIGKWLDVYTDAASDTSGEAEDCGAFVSPGEDVAEGSRPTRLDPRENYTVPAPEEPLQWGPPAAPSGAHPPAEPAEPEPPR